MNCLRQSKIVLRRHLTSQGVKPFEFALCGLNVPFTTALTKHKKIHVGERPYKCSKCGEKFTHKKAVIAHLLNRKQEDGVDFSVSEGPALSL